MRDDMFKVIVERPRRGSRWIASPKLDRDRNGGGGFVGLRRYARQEARCSKWFNENLAPLKRFLRSRRGRPWDEVYAEICATLDIGSTVKMHVRQHLDDIVHRRITYGRDGELLSAGERLMPLRVRFRHSAWDELYVDPDDGLLKDAATFWRARGMSVPSRRAARGRFEQASADLRWIGDRELLWRRDGTWFRVTLDRRPRISDASLATCLGDGAWRTPQSDNGYADPALAGIRWPHIGPPLDWTVIALRQLSKRALRRHGLTGGGDA